MKKINILTFLFFIFLSSVCHSAYMGIWREDFETTATGKSELNTNWSDLVTVGLRVDEEVCVSGACSHGNIQVESSTYGAMHAARYGDKYLRIYADVDADACSTPTKLDDAFKSVMRFYGLEANARPYVMEMGVEYWIAFSIYIPDSYVADKYDSLFIQFKAYDTVAGTDILGKPQFTLGTFSINNDISVSRVDWFSIPYQWQSHDDEWVDVVIHVNPATQYTPPNANSIFDVYINGTRYPIKGAYEANMEGGGWNVNSRPTIDPFMYNIALAYPTQEGTDTEDACVYCDSAYYTQPSPAFTRDVVFDSFAISEGASGTYNYCSVAPPIPPAKPKISSPTAGQTDVGTSFTAVYYSAYQDSRTDDLQDCFGRDHTEVQLQLSGGDWSSLVWSTDTGGTVSTVLSNLSSGQTYQVRVRNVALRSGTSDTYESEWSDPITFSTSGGVINYFSPTSQLVCSVDPVPVEVEVHTLENWYCRVSTDVLDLDYDDMTDQFTEGEGTLNHRVHIPRDCGTSIPVYVACSSNASTGVGINSERVTITLDVAEASPSEPNVSYRKIVRVEGAPSAVFAPNGISMQWVSAGGQPVDPSPSYVIVDNLDAGTEKEGNWVVSSGLIPWGVNSYAQNVEGNWFQWSASITGSYQIAEWHTEYSSRSAAVPFQVYDGSVAPENLLIDTTVNHFINGGQWNNVGSAQTFTGPVIVRVTVPAPLPEGAKSVSADAIKFTKQ